MDTSHVLVISTFTTESARAPRRRRAALSPGPEAGPRRLCRATVVDVASPLSEEQARTWVRKAGETEVEAGLAMLNRAVQAYRIAAYEPLLSTLGRHQTALVRVGYGAGEELAEGRYSEARELPWQPPRRPRRRVLAPEGRLAALLGHREQALVGEELALRARLDLAQGRSRHAALQARIALDATIAELAHDPSAGELAERLQELRGHREAVAAAAQAALEGPLDDVELAGVQSALERIEAAFRARAVARS